jgi:chaperonin GroES
MNTSGLTPLEFFVVVELDPTEQKTPGGIILTSQTAEADKLATQEGTLIAVSPHAFSYADNWPEGSKPEVGARVLFKRFAGHLHKRNERDYRLLNDKDVVAVVEAPEALPVLPSFGLNAADPFAHAERVV